MSDLVVYVKKNKLGIFTLALSLTYIFIGLPDQIWTIQKTQSVAGVSLSMFCLLAAQSTFWVLYGIQRKDWPMVTANFFVVIFAIVIIVQCFFYD